MRSKFELMRANRDKREQAAFIAAHRANWVAREAEAPKEGDSLIRQMKALVGASWPTTAQRFASSPESGQASLRPGSLPQVGPPSPEASPEEKP